MDFALTATGDLDLSSGQLRRVTGAAETIQRLRHAVRLFLGEWFLSPQAGVPYREIVWPRTVSIAAKTAMFRKLLTKDPGVASVIAVRLVPDTAARTAVLTFTVQDKTGAILRSSDFSPVVVY